MLPMAPRGPSPPLSLALRLLVLFLALALFAPQAAAELASEGCGRAIPPTARMGRTVGMQDGKRRYTVFLPDDYNSTSPMPLILSFHGGNRNSKAQRELDCMTTAEFNEDHIVVYPESHDDWTKTPNLAVNNVKFVTSLLDTLEATYCIDKHRIFATGKSDGGGMVGQLACDATISQRIAAFAPVAGAFYVDLSESADAACRPDAIAVPCNPGRARVPILEIHGVKDHTIRYKGGARRHQCLPSIPNWVRQWAARNGLGSANTSYALTADTTVYEFGAAANASGVVTHIADRKLGHDWPSTVDNKDNVRRGNKPASFNASSIIIEFFRKNPLA